MEAAPVAIGEHVSIPRPATSAAQSLLAGQVLDAAGGAIVGAQVIARSASASEVQVASSDGQGRFQLQVAEGPVQLEAGAEAYASSSRDVEAPARDLVLVLAPASALSGIVLRADDRQPLAQVLVQITTQELLPPRRRTIQTDARGEFLLDDVASGEYELLALDAAWRSDPRVVTLGVAEASARLELVAKPAGSLSGVVRVEGLPCAEGYALLVGGGLSNVATVTQSELRFDSVWPGRYDFTLGCANAPIWKEGLQLGLGSNRREWDLSGGLRVEGTVLNADGSPRSGALVDVMAMGEPADRAGARCTSDELGRFRCRGLAPGRYECHVGDTESESDSVQLTIPGASPVVLRSVPLARLEVSLEGVVGADLAQFSVWAQRVDAAAIPAQRDGDQFVFGALALGAYDVRLAGASAHASVRLERAGELAHMQLGVPPSSEISGTVIDAAGQAVPDVWVHARPARAPLGMFLPPAGTSSLSDGEGRFTIAGLFDGLYSLSASGAAGGGRVEEVSGGHRGIQLALKPLE